MAYTVTQLITNAYYLSQVVSRSLETVSGDQLTDGLNMLNALLSLKSANTNLIPYYSEYQFTAVVGQEVYFIPNLVMCETFTFNIGELRFCTYPVARRQYQGSSRVDNIESLPYNYNIERCLGGANLSMYFLPEMAYPCKVWGKFGFDSVTLNEDLSTVYELYYIDYLRYRLAQRICSEYGIIMLPEAKEELREFEALLMNISPGDLTLTKITGFQSGKSFGWGDVNLGKGWRPGT